MTKPDLTFIEYLLLILGLALCAIGLILIASEPSKDFCAPDFWGSVLVCGKLLGALVLWFGYEILKALNRPRKLREDDWL